MPVSPSETHHGERCPNPHSSLSDHPVRTLVPLALRYEGSEHRTWRDLSLDLTSLAATLSRIVLLSPLHPTLTKNIPRGRGVPLPTPAFPPAQAPVVNLPRSLFCATFHGFE